MDGIFGYVLAGAGAIIGVLYLLNRTKTVEIRGLKMDNAILKSDSETAAQESTVKEAKKQSATSLEDYRAKKNRYDALSKRNK